jgi:hypothetical protein
LGFAVRKLEAPVEELAGLVAVEEVVVQFAIEVEP